MMYKSYFQPAVSYNYTAEIDISKKEVKPFEDFIWSRHGMKPLLKFRGVNGGEWGYLNIKCYGYSLEEKAKNKKMIHEAIGDFRKYSFELGL